MLRHADFSLQIGGIDGMDVILVKSVKKRARGREGASGFSRMRGAGQKFLMKMAR